MRVLFGVLILCGGVLSAAEPPAALPPEQVAECVRQLGAANWPAREDAQKRLLAAGRDGLPLLRKARDEARDLEVKSRLELVLLALDSDERTRVVLTKLAASDWTTVQDGLEVLLSRYSFDIAFRGSLNAFARKDGPAAPLLQRVLPVLDRGLALAQPVGNDPEAHMKLRREFESLRREVLDLAQEYLEQSGALKRGPAKP